MNTIVADTITMMSEIEKVLILNQQFELFQTLLVVLMMMMLLLLLWLLLFSINNLDLLGYVLHTDPLIRKVFHNWDTSCSSALFAKRKKKNNK